MTDHNQGRSNQSGEAGTPTVQGEKRRSRISGTRNASGERREYSLSEITTLCLEHLPRARNLTDITNIRMAARFAWEREEMGGIEHVQFAYRNDTPIVPVGHCGHPLELVKRGFIDGVGWPKEGQGPAIKFFKWPDGNHWYATVDGEDVVGADGNQKWNTQQAAALAADKYVQAKSASLSPDAAQNKRKKTE